MALRNQLDFGFNRTNHGKRGRALTYELLDELLESLEDSQVLELSCQAVGVTEITVGEWLRNGRDLLERLEAGQISESALGGNSVYVDAFLEISQALARFEIEDIKTLNELIGDGDFRALKFKLERRSHTRWGKKDHLTIEESGGGRVSKEPRIVSYEAEIADAPEFKMLEEAFTPIEDVEIIEETR